MKLMIDGGCEAPLRDLLHKAANAAQHVEGILLPCAVQLSLVDDEEMREINRVQRGKDSTTDVLSFPSVAYEKGLTAGQAESLLKLEWDVEQAACYLGDVIISLPRAMEQARAYGHSQERELCYLLVHGLFHLFGYDHILEEDKQKMRKQEEKALQGIVESPASDEALLAKARAAMEQAYVPYSHFRVGACVLDKSGRMFTGCNIENASYGLTNCGERTAIFKAVSEGAREPVAIAIASDHDIPWPCGACRQVLSEFAADLRVLLTWGEGHIKETTLKELLPHSFSPANGVQDVLNRSKHG